MNTPEKTDTDYMLEQTLARKSPDLHRRFRDSVVVLTRMLSGYQQVFPNFTDHTELHSLNVLAFCNCLVGTDNIELLNEDEIYILLMACYIHDIGMGIRDSDYHSFLRDVRMEQYLDNINEDDMPQTIRKLHHEFSGMFIRKYADLFDIPSEEHLFAIIQASRGHRKTDLLDESKYSSKMKLPNGNTVCLPYISLLIRLADEIDVAADRNSVLLYCMCDSSDDGAVMAFATHEAIRTIRVEPDSFVLFVKTEEEWVNENVRELAGKMQETLDYCREVAESRSRAKLSQRRIVINYIKEPE